MARTSTHKRKKKKNIIPTATQNALAGDYSNAVICFYNGERHKSQQICQHILSRESAYSDALHLLGLIRYQDGQAEEAAKLIEQAIESNRHVHHYHNSLGLALQALGRTQDAIGCFRNAVGLKPDYAGGFYNLGHAFEQMGMLPEAVEHYRKAIRLQPDDSMLLNDLGNAFRALDHLDDAARCYERAIALEPNYADALCNMGNVLKLQHRFDRALEYFEEAIRIKPDCADAYNNFGATLKDLGQSERALKCYRKAIELQPEHYWALHNLAIELRDQNLFDEALDACNQALRIKEDYAKAYDTLGNLYVDLGNLLEAQQSFIKALELEPHSHITRSNLLFSLNYRQDLSRDQVFVMHQKLVGEYSKRIEVIKGHKNSKLPERRLKVGYLSRDFRWHSVAFFLYPLLDAHDTAALDVHCYADVAVDDDMTALFRRLSHTWRNVVGRTDEELSDLIQKDEIDILVDLAGHSAKNRWPVFARKPSPIQVTYLGYPNTTGLDAVDYRITDGWADPLEEDDHWHSEKLIRLTRCFLSYQAPSNAPDVSPLPAEVRGFVTFGSFNNRAKINDDVVALWSQILLSVPSSRLVLKHKIFASDVGRSGILRLFEKHGVAAERIDLLSFVSGIGNHLALYNDVDIALDTFPYNGTTTTCEALWMGVPVITLAGDRHAARVGVSILSTLGLDEWIATAPRDYREKAIERAKDLSGLKEVRSRLRSRMEQSALLDGVGLARSMEKTYQTMWHKWCEEPETSREEMKTKEVYPSAEIKRIQFVNGQTGGVDLVTRKPKPVAPAREQSTRFSITIQGDIRVCVPDSLDEYVTYALQERGEWYEEDAHLISSLLTPGMRVLHVGADYGPLSLILARDVGKEGKVFALDRDASKLQYLQESIRVNAMSNLECDIFSHQLDTYLTEKEIDRIDFVCLQSGEEVLQIVQGAVHFLLGQSPLIRLSLPDQGAKRIELCQRLTRFGYTLQRYVPGLGFLAPLEMEKDPDQLMQKVYACKNDLAEALKERNLLISAASLDFPLSSEMIRTSCEVYLDRFAYEERLKGHRSSVSLPNGDAYRKGLDLYAAARMDDQPPEVRYRLLRAALDEISSAIQGHADLSRAQTFARISWELGMNSIALSTLELLFDMFGSKQALQIVEPFIPVSPRYDTIDPGDNVGEWCLSSIIEQLEIVKAPSSFFGDRDSMEKLNVLKTLGFESKEMTRRRNLMEERLRRQANP